MGFETFSPAFSLAIDSGRARLYADDLCISFNGAQELENFVDQMEASVDFHGIKFNLQKCKRLITTKSRKNRATVK